MSKYNVTFQEEYITAELFDEMFSLLEYHRKELSHLQDIQLNPNIEQYIMLSSLGSCRMYTARNEDGKLVAYLCYFVHRNLHYQDYIYAMQDVLHVDPSHRGYFIANRLIEFANKELENIGVNVVTQHVSTKKDFGKLLERLGYNFAEKVYMRRLQ